jgi:hypothetical protein
MNDAQRLLGEMGHHFKLVALPSFGKAAMALVAFVFVHDPQAYTALAGLIVLDTITGYLNARRRGVANSRTLKLKLVSKLLTYLSLLVAYGLFFRLVDAGKVSLLSGLAEVFGVLVIASIGAVELRSLVENIRALSGMSMPVFRSPEEILDYLEANHVLSHPRAGQPDRDGDTPSPDRA